MPDQQVRETVLRIREKLAKGQSVTFKPGGTSMLPTFRPNRDTVILSPLPETLLMDSSRERSIKNVISGI